MEDKIDKACAARDRDDFVESYRLWKELAEEDPEHLMAYGWAAYRLDHWEEAQDALERARELDPNAQIIMQMLGHVWACRTDKDDAEQFRTAEYWFLKALERGKTAPILTMLGAVYVELQNIPRGVESFEEALKVDENYEEAMYNLAVLKTDDMPLAAIELLERAIEIDPDYAIAHQKLGALHQKQRDVVRAEYHFRRAVDSDPADYWNYLYLANALAVQKKDEEAENLYEFATQLHPDIEGGKDVFAKFLEQIGKHKKASVVRSSARRSTEEGKP
jgi:tetratricopeptide (TPR) repeat protein